MVLDDVDPVAAIASQTPAQGWSAAEIAREVRETPSARYLVVVDAADGRVLGFAGMWLVVDIAHVTNMGVHPQHRRRGLGRLLLRGLIDAALDGGTDAMTLEVRPSNAAARALYEEFGFYVSGERRRYYVDPPEDALIMTTEGLSTPAYGARLASIDRRIEESFQASP